MQLINNPFFAMHQVFAPKIPPPLQNENFMGMGFSCRNNAFFQAPIKFAQAFPAPELRANSFTDTRIFQKKRKRQKCGYFNSFSIFSALTTLGPKRSQPKTSFEVREWLEVNFPMQCKVITQKSTARNDPACFSSQNLFWRSKN